MIDTRNDCNRAVCSEASRKLRSASRVVAKCRPEWHRGRMPGRASRCRQRAIMQARRSLPAATNDQSHRQSYRYPASFPGRLERLPRPSCCQEPSRLETGSLRSAIMRCHQAATRGRHYGTHPRGHEWFTGKTRLSRGGSYDTELRFTSILLPV